MTAIAARALARQTHDELLKAYAQSGGVEATKQDGRFVFTGTPGELAETLIDWGELGLTGFRLQPAVIPHDLEAVTRGLVPVLQQRGVYRRTYEASTLRGLLGLTRPANRYAAARATEAAATQ